MNSAFRDRRIRDIPAAIVHLGAPSDTDSDDGCASALQAALSVLGAESASQTTRTTKDVKDPAVQAAVAAVVVLENDGRFNAGNGANLRLDGRTVEMDAAVAASDGRFGGVGAISDVKNPILVAEQVLDLPHLLLVGEGATSFAKKRGFVGGRTVAREAIARYKELRTILRARNFASIDAAWSTMDLGEVWNFDNDLAEMLGAVHNVDTVGVCTRDIDGNFAAAASTGGTALALRGRVGDTPIYGAGLFAGPLGAVAATGRGEDIIRVLPSRTIYEWIENGMSAQSACERGVSLFRDDVPVGFIALDATGVGAASNRKMVFAASREY